jgi:hypothetical protein
MDSNQARNERTPPLLGQPWWLDKARRDYFVMQFIIICVIVALLFLGTAIYLSQPV